MTSHGGEGGSATVEAVIIVPAFLIFVGLIIAGGRYTVATQAWATARMANYDADDEIQLRSCDYHGELDVVYRGRAYSVIQKMDQGDFTRLILQRKKPDVGEEDA